MATTGHPCNCCRRNDTGVPCDCCCFQTQEDLQRITIPAPSGFLVPEPAHDLERLAAMLNPKQRLAMAQFMKYIEDFKGVDGELAAADNVEKLLAIAHLMKTDVEFFKSFNAKFGAAGDNVGKARKIDWLARWGRAIVKGFNKCFRS